MSTHEALERRLTGRAEPPAEPVLLHAGPLQAQLVGGDLRCLKVGGVEIVRRLLRHAVLALRTGQGRTFLLANMTRRRTEVAIDVGTGATGTMRVLDTSTVPGAVEAPVSFLRSGTPWSSEAGLLPVTLEAFAYARVDVG